jgi:hypothetical protein
VDVSRAPVVGALGNLVPEVVRDDVAGNPRVV